LRRRSLEDVSIHARPVKVARQIFGTRWFANGTFQSTRDR